MNWFGESWGASVCDPDTHIATPVSESCVWCTEPFVAGDAGAIGALYQHRVRSVDDPDEVVVEEAAAAEEEATEVEVTDA